MNNKLKRKGLEYIEFSLEFENSALSVYIDDIEKDYGIEIEDSEKYIHSFSGEILATGENDSKKTYIGRFNGYCIDIAAFRYDENISFLIACDELDQEISNFAAAIVDENSDIPEESFECYDNIVFLDRIFIEKEYRGCNIGAYLIRNFGEIFKCNYNFYIDAIILLPIPQEKNSENHIGMYQGVDAENRKNKLVDFYKKLDFNKFNDTDYMIRIEK